MKKLKQSDVPKVRNALAEVQRFFCPLCLKRWSVAERRRAVDMCLDHDHKTGHIRGVLCRNCNGMEGKLNTIAKRAKRSGSELEWLRRVVEYWETAKARPLPYLHPTHKTEDEKRLLRNKRARIKRARAKK